MTTTPTPIIVGAGDFRYKVQQGWEQLPPGWSFVEVAGVATDSRDRAYVFNRGEHPVIVFDRDGRYLASWGEGLFQRPHGIAIGPDDAVYCTDDLGHAVYKFTTEGKLLATLGTPGKPSPTGAVGHDYRTVRQSAGPFNLPTNVAFAPDGSLFISDGYGNARVHHFSADGELLASWGAPGEGPGQFNIPHGIAVDPQWRVYVADRENSRVQVFTRDGELLGIWTDVARPMQVVVDSQGRVLVAEVGWRAGRFPWQTPPAGRAPACTAEHFRYGGPADLPLGRRRRPLRAGRVLRPARSGDRLARRPLRRRGRNVGGRQTRRSACELPFAAEVRAGRRIMEERGAVLFAQSGFAYNPVQDGWKRENSMSTTASPVTYGKDASIARFSVARYQRMIEAGIVTADDKVELLENYVVLKIPRNPPHDGTIDLVKAALPPALPAGWLLRIQQTIVLSDSQPEPDFAVVRGTPRSFLTHHPGAADVGLIVEVADSSLLRDQRDKARIYARGEVPCYWIVNLADARIEVYTQPSGPVDSPDYAAEQTYEPGDHVPVVLDGNTVGSVPASELLP